MEAITSDKNLSAQFLTCDKNLDEIDPNTGFSFFDSLKCPLSRLDLLLPYSIENKANVDLKNGLNEYQTIIKASIQAIHALKEGALYALDPLVGENACEIRALWISLIASKNLVKSNDLLLNLTHALSSIQKLLDKKIINILMSSSISLMDLCKKEEILIYLTQEESFVIQSFILTQVKINTTNEISLTIKEKSDCKMIRKFGDISYNFADKLVSKIRRLIAILSVNFMQEMTSQSKNDNLATMISKKFLKIYQNYLPCIPMYWTYKSILLALQRENMPIILHVRLLKKREAILEFIDEDFLFFEPIQDFNHDADFREKLPLQSDYARAAFIIQGIAILEQEIPSPKVAWKEKIKSYSIKNIILAGAADHRQYPDVEYDQIITDLKNQEYENYKTWAKLEGFSLDNPTTFFIQHVYSSLTRSFFHKTLQKINN